MYGSGRWKDLAFTLNYSKILDKKGYEDLKRELDALSRRGNKNFGIVDTGLEPKKELIIRTLKGLNPLAMSPGNRSYVKHLIKTIGEIETRKDLDTKVTAIASSLGIPTDLVPQTQIGPPPIARSNTDSDSDVIGYSAALGIGLGKPKKCRKCGLYKL